MVLNGLLRNAFLIVICVVMGETRADLIFNISGSVNSSTVVGVAAGSSWSIQLKTNANAGSSLNNASYFFGENPGSPFVGSLSGSVSGLSITGPFEEIQLSVDKNGESVGLQMTGGSLNGLPMNFFFFSVPNVAPLLNTPVSNMSLESTFKLGSVSNPTFNTNFAAVTGSNRGMNGSIHSISISSFTAVPEPTSIVLFGVGTIGMVASRLSRRKRNVCTMLSCTFREESQASPQIR